MKQETVECEENDMMAAMEHEYRLVSNWALKVPGVQDLSQSDREALVRSNFFHVIALRIAHRSMESRQSDEGQLLFDNGATFDSRTCPPEWYEWFENVLQLSVNMKAHPESETSAIACLCALILIDISGIIFCC